MSRSVKIILYLITFLLFIFFSVILIVRASYMIPVDISGANFERSFSISYLILFGIIAFLFGSMAGLAFMTKMGKTNSKEAFAYKKRYLVYSTSLVAFGLFYFISELLVGYIVLNINNPYTQVNNTYNSIIAENNKAYNNLDYFIRTDNTNMFILNGSKDVSFLNSVIGHYGNGIVDEFDNNSIVRLVRDSNLFIKDSLFNVYGDNSEVLSIDSSKVDISSTEFRSNNNTSLFIYSNNSNLSIYDSTFSSNSYDSFIFSNNSNVLFDSCKFNVNEINNDLFYLYSDINETNNTLTLKNINYDSDLIDLIRIDKSIDSIVIENSSINIDNIEKYFLKINNSNVDIQIKNSYIKGNIIYDENSKVKLILENSTFEGNVIGDTGIDLMIDDNSSIVSSNPIKVNEFAGSDISFQKINNFVILNNKNQENE